MKLYTSALSPPVRGVKMFLALNNIPYEEILVNLAEGEQHGDSYGKINPNRKVPVLDDDGFVLTESVAILQYLVTKPGIPSHWYPEDPKLRARVNEFMVWHHCDGTRNNGIFRTMVKAPLLTQKPVNEEELKDFIGKLEKALNMMENYFLKGDTGYIAGTPDITIADLMGYAEIRQSVALNYPVTRGRPRMEKWMSNVEKKLGPLADELHATVNKFCAPHARDF